MSAYRICGVILKLYELAPCVVGVGYDELAGSCVGEGYYIALEVVDVIIEVVAAVRHGDTVALLIVEEAQGRTVGRLGENLRSVEQVLGRSRAHGFARADAFRVVGEAQICSVLPCTLELAAFPVHSPATVKLRIANLVILDGFALV